MRYISTRGVAPARTFDGVLLAGLAEDGGLFVPDEWPVFSPAELRAMRGLPYAELAARVMAPFVCGGAVSVDDLQGMCRAAYRGFDRAAVVPLVQLEPGLFALELFHGPTLAFKDLALQVAGRLFDHVLEARDERVMIVGATSGDTGSAAIEACRDRSRVDIAILHPEGRTSEVQRRQMTTVRAPNVLNIAVGGNFDDCQDLVKAMFADAPFRTDMRLSAVNSINWARIAGQIPYFVAAALALGAPDRAVAVSVPTGNFGNVLAAWAAQRMGVPIARFIVGSNANDILARFLSGNDMSTAGVVETLSPSMDIQVSSNFERLLFEFLHRDAGATAHTMADFRTTGRMTVPEPVWRAVRREFTGFSLDDAATLAEIRRIKRDYGYIAEPHTAIGIAAARACGPIGIPVIAAATAHPAKFPDAMERAIGIRPSLPEPLKDLYHRHEVFQRSSKRLAEVQALVRNFAHRNNA
ncbi:threonine synthase [Acidiphilium sp. PA]|uniref:threonine synthase n=1 Tax=Acidiphilium sp. PA TaxID=2871705 RepID=UPI002244CC92|nr:threonine synthase [Acidiphilium sp. PA]MCW8307290.1 threonine synthase [Acidiphilium sp. PA]